MTAPTHGFGRLRRRACEAVATASCIACSSIVVIIFAFMSINFAQATGIDDESGTYRRVRNLARPRAGDTYVFLLPSGL
jgi:hypothetical protein